MNINIVKNMSNLLEMQALCNGEKCTLNWTQGGGALVERKGETYYLYEVALYGGSEHFYGSYSYELLHQIIDVIETWT